MAYALTAISHIGTNAWQYEYTGTAPFEIQEKGRTRLSEITSTIYQVSNSDDEEPPVYEIFDSTETPANSQGKLHPTFARLQWRGNMSVSDNTSHYRIEQYISSTWTVVQRLANFGLRYYSYESEALDDNTTHQFRIIPVDSQENDGPALQFDIDMVRNPDVPSISTSYDSGTGDLTVSAR
jgi:hypothetical protein